MAKKNSFLHQLGKRVYLLDGAMGTILLQSGVKLGESLEELNLKSPKLIEKIHKDYILAGADIIETNTFGANRLKLEEYGLGKRVKEVNNAAVHIARKSAQKKKVLVGGSVGPTGRLIEPLGDLSFDEAVSIYKEQIEELKKTDLLIIETVSDIQEARAAVIAAKSITTLPIMVNMTYSQDGRTVTGTPPEVSLVVLSGLGVDIVGMNCSLGPYELEQIVEAHSDFYKQLSYSFPRALSAIPNAGLPTLEGKKAVYKMNPKDFSQIVSRFVDKGVTFIGGCCGTTPDHIKELRKHVATNVAAGFSLRKNNIKRTYFASRTKVVQVAQDTPPLIIGERLNPTARKALREELEKGKVGIYKTEALAQAEAGADLLDVNVGHPGINEVEIIKRVIPLISASVDLPLCIDSPRSDVIEEALKIYPGKALINSITGDMDKLKNVLPLAKKYGAGLIGLTLDEKGIPPKAENRFKLAQKMIEHVKKEGIEVSDLFVDSLVLAASAQQEEVKETIKTISLIKEKTSVRTSLGISNVSFGLPNRQLLNHVFLAMAFGAGLDAAIVNPLDPYIHDLFHASSVLTYRDREIKKYLKYQPRAEFIKEVKKAGVIHEIRDIGPGDFLAVAKMIVEGDKESILGLVETMLKNNKPQDIIDKGLLKGIEIVGEKFSNGEYFLPQVMASAGSMKIAFERLKKDMKASEIKTIGTVVIATVKGDIHDIGKNIVSMILENHGFKVIDLGKNVECEKIVNVAKKEKADIIALSALLTTTMLGMREVSRKIKDRKLKTKLMIGGAVVNDAFAKEIGAIYAKDAIEAAKAAKKLRKI